MPAVNLVIVNPLVPRGLGQIRLGFTGFHRIRALVRGTGAAY